MDTARVIQVVETTLLRRGDGIPSSPIRIITQYWSLEGVLLAEVDPMAGEGKERDLTVDLAPKPPPLCFGYVNYRGEFANRRVDPKGLVYGKSPYHDSVGWLLEGRDLDKQADRTFMLKDVVTPFSDGAHTSRHPKVRSLSTLASLGDKLQRGDILRVIDDNGTMEKIWSAP
jgi:hypothetical protein